MVGTGELGGIAALDDVDEGLTGCHAVDVTRIVAEEDTTEGGKGADEVGFPGHWRLDAIDIAGGREADTAARHACVADAVLRGVEDVCVLGP